MGSGASGRTTKGCVWRALRLSELSLLRERSRSRGKGGSADSKQGCGWRHNARVSEVEAWLVILPDRDRG